MPVAMTKGTLSPKLSKVAERAKREPEGRFYALAYLIDEEALLRSYQRIRRDAAVGIDGVTKEAYGENLETNLRDLHGRMKSMRYRHQPLRRVEIPKEGGKTRSLGISSMEDKIVQDSLRETMEAIYEQDFLDCSYGFRRGRRAHDALRALNEANGRGELNFVLEADIEGFFDNIDRKHLRTMLEKRIADGSFHRLIGKCLHVGVLLGQEYSEPETGTPQGSILSPLLGNVYLHYVLDDWFERTVKPRLKGRACLIRYCDDFVIGFELEDDALRVNTVLHQRMERFGLRLHPEKTRLLDFRRPRREEGTSFRQQQQTFDFLGFTVYWQRTRKGRYGLRFKTRKARVAKALNAIYDFCRRQRHESVRDQHAALRRRLMGHYNYFGVNGNARSLRIVCHQARRTWFRWLCRRSQRKRLNWQRYLDLLRDFPLPEPRLRVQIWQPNSTL